MPMVRNTVRLNGSLSIVILRQPHRTRARNPQVVPTRSSRSARESKTPRVGAGRLLASVRCWQPVPCASLPRLGPVRQRGAHQVRALQLAAAKRTPAAPAINACGCGLVA